MTSIFKPAALLICSFLSYSSHASIIYDVFDTSKTNCAGAAHGLWTNTDIAGGTCSNYFSIDGKFTLFNDDADSTNWYATLSSTATNPQNVTANIDLIFTGFEDSWAGYKQETGAPYNPATMDFFSAVSGTIDILGTSYDIDSFVGPHAFQYGDGANAKDADKFGGSAWIQSPDITSHHWDLNLVFAAPPGPSVEIPEPSTLLLFGLAFLGLVSFRKRSI